MRLYIKSALVAIRIGTLPSGISKVDILSVATMMYNREQDYGSKSPGVPRLRGNQFLELPTEQNMTMSL